MSAFCSKTSAIASGEGEKMSRGLEWEVCPSRSSLVLAGGSAVRDLGAIVDAGANMKRHATVKTISRTFA
jgi:hypothetical protein